jgi:hypothetical protein
MMGTVDSIGWATSEPGFVESIIPIYGSVRNMMYHANRNEWGWATFYASMAILDAFMLRSLIQGGMKIGWKVFTTPGLFKGLISREPLHFGWQVWGRRVGWWSFEALLNRETGTITVRQVERCAFPMRSFFYSPVLSSRLAMISGQPAKNCLYPAIAAWSRGNFHLPYFLGSRLAGLFSNKEDAPAAE